MSFRSERYRTVGFIFMILIFGLVLGNALGLLVGAIVPEGVVRDFFIKSISLGWSPFTIDLYLITFTLGFSINISVLSIAGLAVAWYYLRYFR